MSSTQNLIYANLQGAGGLSTGQNRTLNTYVAMAIINKGVLPADGAAYAGDAGGSLVPAGFVNGQWIAKICQDLAIFNKARWLPNGSITGSQAETVNVTEGQIYGLDPADATTGETMDMFDILFKNYFQNRQGLNAIRSRPRDWDIVLFTNNTAEIYRRDGSSTVITKITDTADGTNTTSRKGTISFATRGVDGQVVPLEGINAADLGEVSNVFYTLASGADVNLTAGTCNGDFNRWVRDTTVTLSSLQMVPSFASPCATYSLYRVLANGTLIPSTGSTYASINTVTGLITFPAAHVLGATKYIAQLQNEVGVHAEYKLEVQIA